MCRYYENFQSFSSTGTCGSGEWIQPAVPDKPVSRRRIPNVIRRRHSGFRHSRHRTCKGTCRHSGNRQKEQHRAKGARPGFQQSRNSHSWSLCHLLLTRQMTQGSSCTRGPYQDFLKGCAVRMSPPEQKVARPHMHEGPKFKIQYSSLVLSQAATWFRTEVLLYLSGL